MHGETLSQGGLFDNQNYATHGYTVKDLRRLEKKTPIARMQLRLINGGATGVGRLSGGVRRRHYWHDGRNGEHLCRRVERRRSQGLGAPPQPGATDQNPPRGSCGGALRLGDLARLLQFLTEVPDEIRARLGRLPD